MVRAFLLPEVGTKIHGILVPLKPFWDEELSSTFWIPNLSAVFDGPHDHRFINCSPTLCPSAGQQLDIVFRDNFLSDGSQLNSVVQKLTNNGAKLAWRGPMLIMEYFHTSETYGDVNSADGIDVLRFLMKSDGECNIYIHFSEDNVNVVDCPIEPY